MLVFTEEKPVQMARKWNQWRIQRGTRGAMAPYKPMSAPEWNERNIE